MDNDGLRRIIISYRGGGHGNFLADEAALTTILRDWREWRKDDAEAGMDFDPLRRYTLHMVTNQPSDLTPRRSRLDLVVDITQIVSVLIFD